MSICYIVLGHTKSISLSYSGSKKYNSFGEICKEHVANKQTRNNKNRLFNILFISL